MAPVKEFQILGSFCQGKFGQKEELQTSEEFTLYSVQMEYTHCKGDYEITTRVAISKKVDIA